MLADRHDDRLRMLVGPPFTGSHVPHVREHLDPWRIVGFVVVQFQRSLPTTAQPRAAKRRFYIFRLGALSQPAWRPPGTFAGGHRDATMILAYRHELSEGLGKGTTASVEPKSEHTQLDCGPDPTSHALRASSASFFKIFFPAMRPDSQAPVI
jgi:hypothetical protein